MIRGTTFNVALKNERYWLQIILKQREKAGRIVTNEMIDKSIAFLKNYIKSSEDYFTIVKYEAKIQALKEIKRN